MKTFVKTATAAGLLAIGFGGTTAHADPLAQLYFSQNAGFKSPVVAFTVGSLQPASPAFTNPTDQSASPTDAAPISPVDTFLNYSWEGGNDPVVSSIGIESFDDGSSPNAETLSGDGLKFMGPLAGGVADATPGEFNEGDWWVLDTLTQTNNVLTSLGGGVANPLWILDALANLRIFEDAARTNLLFLDEDSRTRIAFTETLNQDDAVDCAGTNPLGTGCDDVFTIIAAELAPVSFIFDGYNYSLNFDLLAGDSTDSGVLADDKSLVVTNDDGSISVFTPEPTTASGTSSIHVMMSYTARAIQVPEPGVLALMSAGILGVGMAARRRRNSNAV